MSARRERIARTATAAVAWTTTLAVAAGAAVRRAALAAAARQFDDPLLFDCAVLGLWAFTNLEMAYAQLRVDERTRAYVYASGANVAMTVAFTVALVVFADQGARGLLLGNFGASAIVVLGLWWVLRRRVSLRVQARRPARDAALRAADRARPTRACTRCRSPIASTCSGSTPRAPPASTRSRSSSRPSCSWRCAASSTRGRRWPTRSRATRRRRGCTRS